MPVLFVIHLLADAGLSFVVLPYVISFHNLFSFLVPNAARFCHLVLYVSRLLSIVIGILSIVIENSPTLTGAPFTALL
jgi:hypothetical protein